MIFLNAPSYVPQAATGEKISRIAGMGYGEVSEFIGLFAI